MKKFINRTNTYLLEKYPIIWNTRIFWVLLASLGIHILFFLFGLVSISNIETFHRRSVIDLFFDNGTVFFGVIVSTLLLVIWLIYHFKHNGFKSYYPTSRRGLFFQFFCYLVIFFSSTTFYYSYVYGVKTYVFLSFNNDEVNQHVKTTNNAAVFFTHHISDYTVDNAAYPDPLDDLYCEDMDGMIDYDKPYIEYLDNQYQFYSLKTKVLNLEDKYVDSIYNGYVFLEREENSVTYFYKDTVVDATPYLKSIKPTYYNFSETFFLENNPINTYNYYDTYYTNYGYTKDDLAKARNRLNYELLERNDPAEIKALLTDFLAVADHYKIAHNLTVESWYQLIHQDPNFEIRSLIRKYEKKDEDDYNYSNYYGEEEQTKLEKLYNEIITDNFIESQELHNVFENIYEIKNENVFEGSIHFFMWISFFLACLIFSFRVTGLRVLLFSIIGSGLLITFISLASVLFAFLLDNIGKGVEFFIAYFSLAMGTIILAIPLFFMHKLKKIVSGVFLNISITGAVLYILLILTIISMHQSDLCEREYLVTVTYTEPEYCFILLEYLGAYTSFILFDIGLVLIYLYTGIIKKWKGLPEG